METAMIITVVICVAMCFIVGVVTNLVGFFQGWRAAENTMYIVYKTDDKSGKKEGAE